MNLTNVQLSNYTYEGNSTGPPPQISKPDSAMVVIQENDNFRGILVFTVTKVKQISSKFNLSTVL